MKTIHKLAIALVAIAVCVLIHALQSDSPLSDALQVLTSLISCGALATSFNGGPNVRDANLKQTVALPTAASSTVAAAAGFDTEASGISDFIALMELLVSAPALTTTMAPNGDTMTYNIIASASANLGSPTVIAQNVIVQTGAGGVGAAAATARFRLPSNIGSIGRYVGLQIVSGAGITNSSAVSGTLEMLF